jgi:hypothetical protein
MRTSNTWKILSGLAISATALSIFAPSAWGQDALTACLSLKDDRARLACFDAATGRTARTRVREGVRRSDDERGRRTDDARPQRTDDERPRRTDDVPQRTDDERPRRTDDARPRRVDDERPRRTDDARPRRADDAKPPLEGGSGVVTILKANGSEGDLLLRCKDSKTDVAIKPRGFVYYAGEPTKVAYRIDQGALVEAQWLASPNGRALYSRSAIQFIKALPDRGKLSVRAYDPDGIAHYSVFELSNVSALRDRLAEACQWDGPPKLAAEPPAIAPAGAPARAEVPAGAEMPTRTAGAEPKVPPRRKGTRQE